MADSLLVDGPPEQADLCHLKHRSPSPALDRSLSSVSDSPASSKFSRSILGDLNVDTAQNTKPLEPVHGLIETPAIKHSLTSNCPSGSTITPESLARDLENFHIDPIVTSSVRSSSNNSTNTVRHFRVSASHSPAILEEETDPTELSHLSHASPEALQKDCQTPTETGSQSDGLVRSTASTHSSSSGIQQAIEQHEARQFEWVLSLPYRVDEVVGGVQDASAQKQLGRRHSTAGLAEGSTEDRKIYFGCNLLQHRARSGSDLAGQQRVINTYTLIATPLGATVHDDRQSTGTDRVLGAKAQTLAVNQGSSARKAASMVDTLLTPERTAPAVNHGYGDQLDASPALLSSPARAPSIARSRSSSVSRIEDTIEELDRLEDEFEAVHSMVRVERVPSPDKAGDGKPARGTAANGHGSVRQKTPGRPAASAAAKKPDAARAHGVSVASTRGATAAAAAGLARTSSVRRSAASSSGTTGTASSSTASKRLSVSRPASLLPPKQLVKSSKSPTLPTFELPGEAVARRLKEQREKRMSAALSSESGTASPAATAGTMRRPRSTKPPTIPTFELPGEAISRRKREEHEAKLRLQEEEERKRREFKARPIRLGVAPSTYPRDTVSSRARQNRVSMIGDSVIRGTGPGAGASLDTHLAPNKRLSVHSAVSPRRSFGQQSEQSERSERSELSEQMGDFGVRGRDTSVEPLSTTSQTSRAASTSAGSVGKQSAISAEDVQQQKARGKQIYHRDNLLSVDRNQEKRERESLAKQARQEAAERSRMLSREWAEKQRQRAKKMFSSETK